MSLLKPHRLTPALLAANRRNAQRSTGPRTPAGKARSALNSLKHGRYSKAFRENLCKAHEDLELFDWIHARVRESFNPASAREQMQAEGLAREVWCLAWRAGRPTRLGTKPESALNSIDRRSGLPLRIRIFDVRSGSRLKFWVPRRRGTAPPRTPILACGEIAA